VAVCIGGGDSKCGTSEAEVEAAETEAVEAEGCIGGGVRATLLT
jgi:hypothetical protein